MSYHIRRSHDRKSIDHGWLNTTHTFSFATYYDPHFMGFRNLRVINEDRVQPGYGFPSHDHHDMEILSLVLEGELAHKDSMGTEEKIHANEVQIMSAGTGVTHSEYNASLTHPVHFFQIWILPETKGVSPRYEKLSLSYKPNEWQHIASATGKGKALKIYQDVEIYSLYLEKGKKVKMTVQNNRYGWLQVIKGELNMEHDTIKTGDGVAINPNTHLALEALQPSRILFFDLN